MTEAQFISEVQAVAPLSNTFAELYFDGYAWREEREDLIAETIEDVWRGIDIFNPKKSSFKTFFINAMKRNALNKIATINRQKRVPASRIFSLDTLTEKQKDALGSTPPPDLPRFDNGAHWSRSKATLTPLQHKCVQLLCQGASLKEIGRTLGLSVSTISCTHLKAAKLFYGAKNNPHLAALFMLSARRSPINQPKTSARTIGKSQETGGPCSLPLASTHGPLYSNG